MNSTDVKGKRNNSEVVVHGLDAAAGASLKRRVC